MSMFNTNIIEIYRLLGNSNLDYKEAIYELVDNSYSAAIDGGVDIQIRISGKWDNHILDLSTAKIIIQDNGSGIERDNFGNCFTPGRQSKTPGKLNQFGAGLKNALMTLGCRINRDNISDFEIISKTKNCDKTYKLDTISDNSKLKEISKEWDHGTIIVIDNVKDIPIEKQHYQALRYGLGVRYRNYINNDPKKYHKMALTLSLEDEAGEIITDSKGVKCVYEIKDISPIFSATDAPIRKTFTSGTGTKWQASVSLHYRPSSAEMDTLSSEEAEEQRNRQHPYYFHTKKVDLISNGIVIQQIPLYDLIEQSQASNDASNRAQYMYLEILLEKGFELVNTKNAIKQTQDFKELKVEIKKWLNGKSITKDDVRLSEKEIHRRLKEIFIEEHGEENVQDEVAQWFGKRPDFKINNTLIELKKDEASVNDVIQLINYCVINGETKAKLYCNGYNSNAANCAKDYLKMLLDAAKKWDSKNNIDIKFVDWKKYITPDKK